MDLSNFLIPLVFIAVILYRVYKKKKNKDTKDNVKENTKDIEVINKGADSPVQKSIHRVYFQSVESDRNSNAKEICVTLETLVSDYLADIDRMGALRPSDIRFFTCYNRVFIVYVWV